MQNDKKPAAIHDGERVRSVLAQLKFSHKEFNNLMGWNARRVESKLNKANWTTDELVSAGTILQYNFFVDYAPNHVEKMLGSVIIPINALAYPEILEKLRGEILALADRIRQQSGDKSRNT